MVFDRIENAQLYYPLGARFQRALEWLSQVDPLSLTSGQKLVIDGDRIFATFFEIDTLPVAESKLEAHRNYADIQCLVSGSERVGYALAGTMAPVSDYDSIGDIQFFNGHWDTLRLESGNFYIVWPQDLHAPRVAVESVSRVRRIVVKVKL